MPARIASALLSFVLLLLAVPAVAAPRETRIPLHDAKLDLGDLSQALAREIGLPRCKLAVGRVNVAGPRGTAVVTALNHALGEGCQVSLTDGALVLRVEPDGLPRGGATTAKAVRVFTAATAPVATAAQASSYGMHLPAHVDPAVPLVVLVHGLDCINWGGMAQRLGAEGYQVAYFTYPSDQPIADSASFFARNMVALRQRFPSASVNVIGYSMGGLVSRAYVEGPDYAGGVERLIMIATPNSGSGWSRVRFALEFQEHYQLWRYEDDWSPTWMITDGLGEAGKDLRPGSKFLRELNAQPRRAGVKYTIIAGDQHPARRQTAELLEDSARLVPKRAQKWWGFRHYKQALSKQANKMHNKSGDGDGPVKVRRAALAGVDDFVIVHADHASLLASEGRTPPAAWDTVRDRLRQ